MDAAAVRRGGASETAAAEIVAISPGACWSIGMPSFRDGGGQVID